METTYQPPAQTSGDHRLSVRTKSLFAGLALAAMMTTGAVTVLAQSPDPSSSPQPAATSSTGDSESTNQEQARGDCPHDQRTDSTGDE